MRVGRPCRPPGLKVQLRLQRAHLLPHAWQCRSRRGMPTAWRSRRSLMMPCWVVAGVCTSIVQTAPDGALRSDPKFAASFDEMIPGASSAVSRTGGRATPAGYTWHHAHSSAAGGRVGSATGTDRSACTWFDLAAYSASWRERRRLFGMGDPTRGTEVSDDDLLCHAHRRLDGSGR